MTSIDQSKLTEAMNEGALLAPDNPLRREVEKEVREAGAWAEEAWLGLLEEDERLRLELQRVHIPPGLLHRMSSIPDQITPIRVIRWKRWGVASVAACAVLAAGFLLTREAPADRQLALQTIVALASDDHLNDRHITINTHSGKDLEEAFQGQVDFQVTLPVLAASSVLIGGRKCRWAGCQVIYSLWRIAGQNCSVIQFCPKRFRLPATMAKRKLTLKQPGHADDSTAVTIWTENGKGYAMVTASNQTT